MQFIGRKKSRSMIATDTPEKESHLAQWSSKDLNSTRKADNTDARSKPKHKKLITEDDPSSDRSSDEYEEEMDNDDHEFLTLEEEPRENDYT